MDDVTQTPVEMQDILHRLPFYDFATFIAHVFAAADPGATYLPNWHIDLIAEHLEAARRGEIQRLIINMRTAREIGFSPRWEFTD